MLKPKKKDYFTDSQLHAAWKSWGESLKRPNLVLEVAFAEEEPFVLHEFEPWETTTSYRAYDKELYTIRHHATGYNPDFLVSYEYSKNLKIGMPITVIKRRVRQWLISRNIPVKSFSLKLKDELALSE